MYMSNMDLCSQSCMSRRPTGFCCCCCCCFVCLFFDCSSVCLASALRGKIFSVVQYAQTFQPNQFIPAKPIGTIDVYHLTPFLVALTFAADNKVTRRWNMCGSYTCIFQLIWMKSDVAFKQFKLNILIVVQCEVCVIKGNSCCFNRLRQHQANKQT